MTGAHQHEIRHTVIFHEISHLSARKVLYPVHKKKLILFVLASNPRITSLNSFRLVVEHYSSCRITQIPAMYRLVLSRIEIRLRDEPVQVSF
jgi:hypothetical protein